MFMHILRLGEHSRSIVPRTMLNSMMTSSNGDIFRVIGHLCGEFTGPRWIPCTKASDAELWRFLWSAFSKQSWGWWFETLPRRLWRHSYAKWIHDKPNALCDALDITCACALWPIYQDIPRIKRCPVISRRIMQYRDVERYIPFGQYQNLYGSKRIPRS